MQPIGCPEATVNRTLRSATDTGEVGKALMSREWLRNVNRGLLLEIIEHRAQRDPSTGKVSFDLSDGMFDDALTVLESSVRFDDATPESMYGGLIHSSLRAIAKSRTLTVKAFENELGKQERAYLANAPERYLLTTSMSALRFHDLLPRTGIPDTHITFVAQLPKLFQQEHERMRQQGSGVLFGDLPKTTSMMTRYSFARVSVWAKSQLEAVESALEGLNLLRGIWNFYHNYRTPWRSSFAGGVAPDRRVQVRRPERRRERVQRARVGQKDSPDTGQEEVRLHGRRRGAYEKGRRLRQAAPRAGAEERRRGLQVALLLDELGTRPSKVVAARLYRSAPLRPARRWREPRTAVP